jgi:tetratricopeptide (TPR) repeat protein
VSELLQDLRRTAPTAARALEYLVVPREFSRDEAIRVLSNGVSRNGYNSALFDVLARVGLLRTASDGWSIIDTVRVPAIKVLSADRISQVAMSWESIAESRLAKSDKTLDVAYLDLLAGDPAGALAIRNEFAAAETDHQLERQAHLARLVSEGTHRLRGMPVEVQASLFYVLGISHYRQGRRARAMTFFERAVQTGADTKDAAICAHLLAVSWARRRNRTKAAEQLFRKSIEILEGVRDLQGVAKVKHSYANMLARQKGRGKEAEKLYRQSVEIENLDNPYGVAQVKHSYANLLAKQRTRMKEAEELYRESIEIKEELNDRYGLVRVRHSYANLLARQRGRWHEAEDLYRESIEIAEELNDPFGVAQVKHSYANLLARQENRWNEAEVLYRESIETGKELDNSYHVAQVSFKYGEFLCANEIDVERGLDLLGVSLDLNVSLRTHFIAKVKGTFELYSGLADVSHEDSPPG